MKDESTSGYPFVTHLHTKAQPCFSPHPQLTPLPSALGGQTCTTLKKTKKWGRETATRQAGSLSGPVSALHCLLSYRDSGAP